MEELIKNWSGESILIHKDEPTGAVIYIAIHSTKLGFAVGGSRMKSYNSPREAIEDALRLSEGMTYKFAAADVAYGGGKCVIDMPERPEGEARREFLHRYGAVINKLGGLYKTGPDSGTSTEDMDVIAEVAIGNIFATSKASGDPGPFTALGTFTGIEAVCETIYGDRSLKAKRVLVQGVGDVGRPLVDLLEKAGAVVMFSDVVPEVIAEYQDQRGFEYIPPKDVSSAPCDIYAPCALGAILNSKTIPELKCVAVAGSANNQLEKPEDAELLRSRNILYAPDYVINCGGAVGNTGIEVHNWTVDEAKAHIVKSVDETLKKIFETSSRDQISTDEAALQIAKERLSQA